MARIKTIIRKKIEEQHLHNLSVEGDESFIAQGVVVHNCKSYIRANLKTSKNKPKVTGLPSLTDKDRESITFKDDK